MNSSTRPRQNRLLTGGSFGGPSRNNRWGLKCDVADVKSLLRYRVKVNSLTKRKEFRLMTTDEYIQCGIEAQTNYKIVRGVYGVSSICALKTFDLTKHCGFDKAHTCSSICKNFLSCLDGSRGKVSEALIELSQKYGFFMGQLSGPTVVPPWRVAKRNHSVLELYGDCIIYPSSLKSEFRCQSFLSKASNLHMDDVLKLFMVVLPYSLRKLDMADAYLAMYYAVCERMIKTLNVIVNTKTTSDLYDDIVELLAFAEGLLPPSEAIFMKHEWIHIPHSLHQMGPYISNNALAIERFQSYLKKWVPRGGRNVGHTISSGYRRFENVHDERFIQSKVSAYNINEDGITVSEQFSNFHATASTSRGAFDVWTLYPHKLITTDGSSRRLRLAHVNPTELSWQQIILAAVNNEIEKATFKSKFVYLANHSTLVRLYWFYLFHFYIFSDELLQEDETFFHNNFSMFKQIYTKMIIAKMRFFKWLRVVFHDHHNKVVLNDIINISLTMMQRKNVYFFPKCPEYDFRNYLTTNHGSNCRFVTDGRATYQDNRWYKPTVIQLCRRALVFGTEMISRIQPSLFTSFESCEDTFFQELKTSWHDRAFK